MRVSPAEIREGRLSDESLSEALQTIRDSGFLILEGVYDPPRIAELNEAYLDLLSKEKSSKERVQPTDGAHHIQMQLPLVPPFSDVDIVANPVTLQVMSELLGNDLRCSYYNSNTALPGSGYQRVHRDFKPIFGPEHNVPTATFAVVVNVPLCDFTEDNGSTEVWPASHLIVDSSVNGDDRADLDRRSAALASTRVNVPVGAIVIRDLRLWHRGTPNRSDRTRSMIALVYKRSWLGWRHHLLEAPKETWAAWPKRVQEIFQ